MLVKIINILEVCKNQPWQNVGALTITKNIYLNKNYDKNLQFDLKFTLSFIADAS